LIIKFALFSPEFNREIPIHLYLPDNYLESRQNYPVLYMFDGHNLFFDEDATYGRSWRLEEHIRYREKQCLIAGIECSHEGYDRLSEYAPYDFYDAEFGGTFEGRGDLTMHFIVKVLMPYMKKHFPVLTGRKNTWIGGSSCGALMAYYALCAYNRTFSKALCLSPYVNPSISSLKVLTDTARILPLTSIYMSWGAREGSTGHAFEEETVNCTDLLTMLIKKHVFVEMNVKIAGEHCEASWEEEADRFLQFLF
jgi:predicted alpha/beta superfamily hydrolase